MHCTNSCDSALFIFSTSMNFDWSIKTGHNKTISVSLSWVNARVVLWLDKSEQCESHSGDDRDGPFSLEWPRESPRRHIPHPPRPLCRSEAAKPSVTGTFTRAYTEVCMSTEVEDVVNAILFLLSDKSKMTNGVTLPVDGGFLACWLALSHRAQPILCHHNKTEINKMKLKNETFLYFFY